MFSQLSLWRKVNRSVVLFALGTFVAFYVFVHIWARHGYLPVPSVTEILTASTPLTASSPVPTGKKKVSWFHQKMTNTEDFPVELYATTVKRILFWTDDYSGGQRYYGIGGLGADVFRKVGCPVWQCEAYDYKSNISHIPVETFDAVVFHDPTWTDRNSRPAKRSPHQRYVWWNQEAPGYHSFVKEWSAVGGFFNWTMTYRWDSDIIHPYGWFTPANSTDKPDGIDRTNHAEGKTKMAAWFVSNCNTHNGRNEYVHRLQKYVHVDVYGRCGTLNCSKGDDGNCRQMLEKTYKFLIAFENSLCHDYVTEKLFRQVTRDVVPVILDVHGNYARFAPPKSYINALDFPSVRHLADYLKLLDSNDTLYNDYFSWKGHYEIHSSNYDFQRGLCRLCSKLHVPLQPRTIYDDLTDWWHNASQCKVLDFSSADENDSWKVKPFDPDSIKKLK